MTPIFAHFNKLRSSRLLATGILALVLPGAALADEVVMNDGRIFQGDIVSQDDSSVRIDTIISGIRAELTLKKGDTQSIKELPLPAGFFDPPSAPSRLSKASDDKPGDVLYLDIPIVGSFGKEVAAEGIRSTLAYARRNRIRHIVFEINGNELSDLDEAAAIFELLSMPHEGITYHAYVHHCVGESLAVALQCDTVAVEPGAKLGGAHRHFSDGAQKITPAKESVYRRELAFELTARLDAHGRNGNVAARMMDSSQELSAWRDDTGMVQFGAHVPDSTPPKSVIFHVLPGEPLQLTDPELIALNVPMVRGGVKELGAKLGFPGWKLESDFGANAMTQAAEAIKARAASKQAQFDAQIQSNIQQRKIFEEAFKHGVSEAAKWDPSKTSYSTFGVRWHWAWGLGGGRFAVHGPAVLTPDSQEKWQERTDTALSYLKQAGEAAVELKTLDEAAAKLGLEPTYKADELDQMIADLETKYKSLQEERNKQFK